MMDGDRIWRPGGRASRIRLRNASFLRPAGSWHRIRRRDVKHPARYAKVPWGDIRESDLREQGEPEFVRDVDEESHIGLHVRGTYGITLGMLAVRCERHGNGLVPLTMAIADVPLVVDVVEIPALQSSQKQHDD
jgi:hypothetical protein